MNHSKIKELLKNHNKFILATRFYGWDPYDVQQKEFYRRIILRGSKRMSQSYSPVWGIVRKVVFILEQMLPLLFRRLFGLKPQINFKSLGLLGLSFLDQKKIFIDENFDKYLDEIDELLLSNDFSAYPGFHWGYPFDWQSKVLIPKNTPSGVVTTAVGAYFLEKYKNNPSLENKQIIENIAIFLSSGLNMSFKSDSEICFSYTPLDTFKVHNLNLFIADFLIKAGRILNSKVYLEIGKKALSFTLNRINDDGSINYSTEDSIKSIDHYHTGFVIRTLFNINNEINDSSITQTIEKLCEFYLANFFEDSKYPKYFYNKLNPIDIHSVSESILTLSLFADKNKKAKEILENVILFAMSTMYSKKENHFYYRVYLTKSGKPILKQKMSYLRWGESWMNFALSRYLLIYEK